MAASRAGALRRQAPGRSTGRPGSPEQDRKPDPPRPARQQAACKHITRLWTRSLRAQGQVLMHGTRGTGRATGATHLQPWTSATSRAGQRSSRQRSSPARLRSSAVSDGSASARLRMPDRPKRSVRSPGATQTGSVAHPAHGCRLGARAAAGAPSSTQLGRAATPT